MQLKRRAHLEVRPSDSVFSGKPATFVLRAAAYALSVTHPSSFATCNSGTEFVLKQRCGVGIAVITPERPPWTCSPQAHLHRGATPLRPWRRHALAQRAGAAPTRSALLLTAAHFIRADKQTHYHHITRLCASGRDAAVAACASRHICARTRDASGRAAGAFTPAPHVIARQRSLGARSGLAGNT